MILDTKTDVKSHQSELVVKAMEIMQKTYSDPDLNMASLADQLGISPVTLAVEFKNETGISPSDYLAVVRLERAKELLRTTDQLVKQVSEAVGYEERSQKKQATVEHNISQCALKNILERHRGSIGRSHSNSGFIG